MVQAHIKGERIVLVVDEVNVPRSFSLTISESRALIREILRLLPGLEQQMRTERQKRIQELERELENLKWSEEA